MITKQKDTDLLILLNLPDVDFFKFCAKFNSKDAIEFTNINMNQLCNNEILWKERLFKFYGNFYPEYNQTWKNLYLKLVYYMDKYKYKQNEKSLIKAIKKGHLEVVKYLFTLPNINTNENYNEAISKASEKGNIEIVNFLSNFPKANIDTYNKAMIAASSKKENLDIIKLMLEKGATAIKEALDNAYDNNDKKLIKYLKSLKNDKNEKIEKFIILNRRDRKYFGPYSSYDEVLNEFSNLDNNINLIKKIEKLKKTQTEDEKINIDNFNNTFAKYGFNLQKRKL